MSISNRVVAVLVGAGVLLLSVFLQELATLPAILYDPAVAFDPEAASRLGIMLMLPLNFIGLAFGGLVYLKVTNRGWDWLDLRRPGKMDVIWMIGGTVLILGSLIVVGMIAQFLEPDPPEQVLLLWLQDDVVLILFMIAVVWLLNAPAEEFVFRNVIQKRLYADFSGIGAILITSLLFAGIHVLTFVIVGQSIIDITIPILGIFIGSVIMGYAYLRTENLYVPIVIHALYNSFQMVILLITVVYDIDEEAMAALIDLATVLF